mmetsp:Transcript_36427/g.65440  ORF Transcript_36427/g.65440 Transcript_36427/m.65440 type:complete len:793 (-) Transcript_36427:107-2485(-)
MPDMFSANEPVDKWVAAVRAFHASWFPENGRVQHFWFGARKPNLRSRFDRLAAEFEEPITAAARAAALRPLSAAGAWTPVPGWPPPALARLRLQTAIFLDQMSRNLAAVGDAEAPTLMALRAACDAAALPLALSVVADAGGPSCGAGLLAVALPEELCFLSLVLRHTRCPLHVALAARVLSAVSQELRRRGHQLDAEEASGTGSTTSPLGLCERFLLETQDVVDAVKVEAYLERAFSTDEPLQLQGSPACDCLPRLSVLDNRCLRWCSGSIVGEPPFLGPLLEPGACTALLAKFQRLVDVLRAELGNLGLLSCERGVVLSLSGGVDSMVTCCLLSLLEAQLSAAQRFRWCALHLCHPNRADAVDEEGWVQWSCHKLGVKLFTYRLQIRRPHGSLRTGISRERYEEKSKELRFRMYRQCFAQLGVSAECGCALVAHHQDDADENRLAELGKSNILHIDGMSLRGTMLNVEVIRPLLSVRKADLIAFADAAAVCYMQDSTPKWSRRGWIRRTLDEIGVADTSKHSSFLATLTRAGAASEDLGNALDTSLRHWKAHAIIPMTLQVRSNHPGNKDKMRGTSNGPDNSTKQHVICNVSVVIVWLPEILQLTGDFEARIASLHSDIAEIADIWNASIDSQGNPEGDGSIAAELRPGAVKEGKDMGRDGEEDDGIDNAPGVCPLQRITVHTAGLGVGPFLFSRAIYSAANECPQVKHLLRGMPIARRALMHLWDCIARARLEYQWGTLHKRCPCLYLRDCRCLVLCDIEAPGAMFADRNWQKAFARAALEKTKAGREEA